MSKLIDNKTLKKQWQSVLSLRKNKMRIGFSVMNEFYITIYHYLDGSESYGHENDPVLKALVKEFYNRRPEYLSLSRGNLKTWGDGDGSWDGRPESGEYFHVIDIWCKIHPYLNKDLAEAKKEIEAIISQIAKEINGGGKQ